MVETLIVEDEILIGMNVKQMVEDQVGAECAVATSVSEARRTVDREKPEFIIMDIKLDESEEGFDLAEEFKQAYDPDVVACTSYSDSRMLEKIRSSPMDGYILKPVSESNIDRLFEEINDPDTSGGVVDLERGELFGE